MAETAVAQKVEIQLIFRMAEYGNEGLAVGDMSVEELSSLINIFKKFGRNLMYHLGAFISTETQPSEKVREEAKKVGINIYDETTSQRKGVSVAKWFGNWCPYDQLPEQIAIMQYIVRLLQEQAD